MDVKHWNRLQQDMDKSKLIHGDSAPEVFSNLNYLMTSSNIDFMLEAGFYLW